MTPGAHPSGPSVVLLHGGGTVPPGSDVVVALTPSAVQACTRQGLDAILIDDVVEARAIVADRQLYVIWQLDWLERLDQAADAGGTLRAAALYLLTPVDSVVTVARRLRALLAALGPAAVTYAGPVGDRGAGPFHAGHLQFWPRLGDTPLVAQLLPLVAQELGFDATLVPGPGDPPLIAPATTSRQGSWLRRRTGPVVRQLQVLLPPVVRVRGTSLLLWSSGYGAARFAAGEHRARRRTFVLERGRPTTRILGLAPWGRRAVGRAVETAVGPRDADAVLPAELRVVLDEVDEWAGVRGAGELLASRLAAVLDIVETIGRAADDLQPQLDRIGVDLVAAANPSSVEEYAALIAAGRAGVRRVLLQHGDHMFPYDSWLVSETQNFDELWVSDASVPGDLDRAAGEYGVAAPEFRLRSPRVEALRRAAAAPPGDKRLTVCYVPSVLLGDSWLFGASRNDDAWYHRWQLGLLDLMAAHPDVDFAWKAYPAADQSFDPIPGEIRRRGVGHVRYETGPLVPHLLRADRVITDFPSTPLYEAVHLGRPVLALTFRRFAELRPSAVALFGPVLRECDTPEEALAAVRGFLDDPAARWLLPSAHVLPT